MRKHHTNNNIFTDENAISFYLLGAFMTDGNIHIDKRGYHRISITSIDEDWIDNFRRLIAPTAKIQHRENQHTLRFRSEVIKNWLISYGCVPNKSKTLQLLKDIPNRYQYDFIRGVIDGDGCVNISKYTKQLKTGRKTYNRVGLYITCGSLVFAQQLQSMINQECESHLYEKKRKAVLVKKTGRTIKPTTYWYVQATETKAQKILQKTYYSENSIHLDRKQQTAERALQLHFIPRARRIAI